MIDPGGLWTNRDALIATTFAAICAILGAVQRAAIISLIPPAFATITNILNKIGTALWMEPPFPGISRRGSADASGGE